MIAVLAAATLTLGLPSLFTDASAQLSFSAVGGAGGEGGAGGAGGEGGAGGDGGTATGGAGGAGGDATSSLIVDLTP